MQDADVTIIGGGVIGCSIAWKLAREGANVVLVERSTIGKEATHAAGGILAPQVEATQTGPFLDLCLKSRKKYPSFVKKLIEQSGIDPQLTQTGVLKLAFDSSSVENLHIDCKRQRSQGFLVKWYTPKEAKALEPQLAPIQGALFFPEALSIDPRILCQALYQAAKKAGVRFLLHTNVKRILYENNRVYGLSFGEKILRSKQIVVTAGSWSSRISGSQIPTRSIEPVRGQMILFKTSPGFLSRIIYAEHGYLVPRKDGRLLVGSTMEKVGFENNVTSEGLTTLRTLAEKIVPALQNAPLQDSWSGLRPGTVDNLPLLGKSRVAGLFWATGHFRNGILLAPITAELISNAILGQNTTISLDAFSEKRFRQETLKGVSGVIEN